LVFPPTLSYDQLLTGWTVHLPVALADVAAQTYSTPWNGGIELGCELRLTYAGPATINTIVFSIVAITRPAEQLPNRLHQLIPDHDLMVVLNGYSFSLPALIERYTAHGMAAAGSDGHLSASGVRYIRWLIAMASTALYEIALRPLLPTPDRNPVPSS
jgi:hypothetical protein